MAKPVIKLKKCAVCKNEFQLFRSLQKCCSHQCALKLAVSNREKDERREHKKAKDDIKTKSTWLDEAETAFRRWIRASDRVFYQKLGKLPECISCGNNNPAIQYAAGHLKTKGSHPEFRFDPKNLNLQCNKRCNKELSGNINGTKDTHGYLKGLEIKYGKKEAEWIIDYLETYRPLPNWTVDQLQEIKTGFNQWARELEKSILEQPEAL